MLMICPRLRSTMPGTTRRVIVSSPLMFVSIMVSQSSKSPWYSGSRPSARPALFTSTSISRHSSGSSLIACFAFSRSLTSNASVSTFVPFASSSSRISDSRCSFLPVNITLSPFSANFLAQPKPIPLVAPVINTILFIISSFLLFYRILLLSLRSL